MNILHIEDEPWDSGMAHYAVTLAAEQKKRGHTVELWGRTGSPVLESAKAAGIPTRGAVGLASWPSLRGPLAGLAPQVINAHTGSAHTLALALAAGSPALVVRTRGDARPARSNPLTRMAAARTAAYIAANSALAASITAAFPSARVTRVPQGIEGPAQAPALPAGPVAGLLARLDPVKGHETAFAALPEGFKLRCAGEGRLAEDLRRRAAASGTRGRVELAGRVPDKWAFIASCRIGLVPSLGSEAVSRAALEWMAAGRPVVASRVGGLPDLIEDGVTGYLVPPGDPAALGEAMKKAHEKAAALGAAGRARWQKSFSLAPFYESTQKVYEDASRRLPS